MKKTLTAKRLLCQLFMKSLQQILLMVLITQLAAAGPLSGQNLLERRVTLSLNRTPLSTALQQLERAAEIKFSYNSRMLPLKSTISLNVQNEPLGAVLDKLLLPNKITYKQVSNRIVLRNDPANINAVEPASGQITSPYLTVVEDRSLVGKVSNEKGEGLPGVSIIIKGSQRGAVTNTDGSYSLLVPDGAHTVVFSFVGFRSEEVSVAEGRTALDVVLKVDEKALEEVVVVGYGTQKKVNLTGSVATVNIDNMQSRQVSKQPGRLAGAGRGPAHQPGLGYARARERIAAVARGQLVGHEYHTARAGRRSRRVAGRTADVGYREYFRAQRCSFGVHLWCQGSQRGDPGHDQAGKERKAYTYLQHVAQDPVTDGRAQPDLELGPVYGPF
jgi:hypothetical protein